MPVCRTCNAEFKQALTLTAGDVTRTVCPNCKDDNVHDTFRSVAEQQAIWRECIETMKRI